MIEHNFKKKYGQNFIKDQSIINKIVGNIDIDKDTLVIEIGPGAGALTSELVKEAGQVIAYEIDKDLKDILSEKFNNVDNLQIIYEDFLTRSVEKDLEEYNYSKIYVVANIPYYITTPIIKKIIDTKTNISKVAIMIQKEVGERFTAQPRTRDYGSITVYLNYYFNIKKLFTVSKNSFIPKPNVDSVVVLFTRKEKNTNVKNEDLLLKIIRDSFQYKRKNLRNNLKSYDLSKIADVLDKYNLNLNARAEELPLEIFIDISNHL